MQLIIRKLASKEEMQRFELLYLLAHSIHKGSIISRSTSMTLSTASVSANLRCQRAGHMINTQDQGKHFPEACWSQGQPSSLLNECKTSRSSIWKAFDIHLFNLAAGQRSSEMHKMWGNFVDPVDIIWPCSTQLRLTKFCKVGCYSVLLSSFPQALAICTSNQRGKCVFDIAKSTK